MSTVYKGLKELMEKKGLNGGGEQEGRVEDRVEGGMNNNNDLSKESCWKSTYYCRNFKYT